MRRTYISPEFDYFPVFGTYNMKEDSSFFGSKMLEIEDSISIKNENITYFQSTSGEQIDIAVERTLPQIVYDTIADKEFNHNLFLDKAKVKNVRNENMPWILDINLKTILTNYLLATMKKWRTFEGVSNSMTFSNNVNVAMVQYIDLNVLSRYKFSKIELFIKPTSLFSLGKLKFGNEWDPTIESTQNLFTKFQTETDLNSENIRVKFFQKDSSEEYSFKYYYNIYFEKL